MARGICGVARLGFCGVARLGFCVIALLRYCVARLAVFFAEICGGPAGRLGFAVAGWVLWMVVARPGWGFAVARLFFGTKICACEFTRKTKKGQINNKAHCAPTTRRLPLAPVRHYTPTPTAHAHYAPWYDVSPLCDARTLTM